MLRIRLQSYQSQFHVIYNSAAEETVDQIEGINGEDKKLA